MKKIKPQKWVLSDDRVVTEDDSTNVFYVRKDLADCPIEVIQKVVDIHNNDIFGWHVGSEGAIDDYLLNEEKCTQEHREFICEEIFKNYYKKLINETSTIS